MPKEHHYSIVTEWKGNLGTGTSGYKAYGRDHEISAKDKQSTLLCSSDPAFRGDNTRYNPEQLLVAALSSCHMLWYLHLCSEAGIIVTSYRDEATGRMRENVDGSGEFEEVTLVPIMTITDQSKADHAMELHHKAHELCFIARSVNFKVQVQPVVSANPL